MQNSRTSSKKKWIEYVLFSMLVIKQSTNGYAFLDSKHLLVVKSIQHVTIYKFVICL